MKAPEPPTLTVTEAAEWKRTAVQDEHGHPAILLTKTNHTKNE